MELDENMPLLEAHNFVSAMEAEILRETPEIDSVLTHIESEPATIEQPEEIVVEDRTIEVALRAAAKNFNEIVDVHEIMVRHAGDHVDLSCHCTLPDDLTMQRVHEVITALEDRFKMECPEVSRVTIHPEPVPTIRAEERDNMIAQSEWKHDDVFEGKAENGNTIVFDADARAHARTEPDGSRADGAVQLHFGGCGQHSQEEAAGDHRLTVTADRQAGGRAAAGIHAYQADLRGARQAEPQGSGRCGFAVKEQVLLRVADVGEGGEGRIRNRLSRWGA